jgi:antitoxin PrlF
MAAIVSEKGQVVIPLAVRKALGIQPGSRIEFELSGGEAKLRVLRRRVSRVEDGLGMVKYSGPPVSIEQMSGLEAARRMASRGRR